MKTFEQIKKEIQAARARITDTAKTEKEIERAAIRCAGSEEEREKQ